MKRRSSFWLVTLCCGLACLVACHGNQSALDSKGLQAARIERLWWLMFSIILAVYLLVLGWFGTAVLRSRTRQSEKEIPPQVNIEADRRMTVVV
ncbi:MAG: hypothetical protein WA672_18110, partial [Candidatus Angelobacter sp.]